MAEAALWFVGLVGTGLVLRGCTRARELCVVFGGGCACVTWTQECACVRVYVCGGDAFQDGVVCEHGSGGQGYICQGRGMRLP